MDIDSLDIWVATHQPDPLAEYGKGWWDGIEFMRMLWHRHKLEDAADQSAPPVVDRGTLCASHSEAREHVGVGGVVGRIQHILEVSREAMVDVRQS